jgi:hypothetical protein
MMRVRQQLWGSRPGCRRSLPNSSAGLRRDEVASATQAGVSPVSSCITVQGFVIEHPASCPSQHPSNDGDIEE